MNKKIKKLTNKKSIKKKIIKKKKIVNKKPLKKKAIKKKKVKLNPDNRSGDSSLDVLVGKRFYWEEPWSDWEPEEIECLDPSLLDEDGNPPNELCGEWEITSVSHDGKDVWVNFVPTDGDQQMELPIEMLPSSVWED